MPFFVQAEDGIRDATVTGVQTCALPIYNKVWVDETGSEAVRVDRADGLGFDFLRAYRKSGRSKAEFFILSKESNPVVQRSEERRVGEEVGDETRARHRKAIAHRQRARR